MGPLTATEGTGKGPLPALVQLLLFAGIAIGAGDAAPDTEPRQLGYEIFGCVPNARMQCVKAHDARWFPFLLSLNFLLEILLYRVGEGLG